MPYSADTVAVLHKLYRKFSSLSSVQAQLSNSTRGDIARLYQGKHEAFQAVALDLLAIAQEIDEKVEVPF